MKRYHTETEISDIQAIQDLIAYAHDHLSHAEALADNEEMGDAILDQISAALARCVLRIEDAQRSILNFGGTDEGTAKK